MNSAKEKLLWSIALPGFGQFLNGKVVKGVVILFLEFLVNVQANFNEAIISSFHRDIEKAIEQVDYQWLMFYPCLYFFAMWDAFKDAGGGKEKYAFLPFVFSAYFVTVGCIYSSSFRIFGVLFGPVWLPMLFVIPGLVVGLLIKKILS
ncbi:hypothetical protein [Metabacillus sediminilitoris]|uniref:Uncharacterized protein n=1 Tax=Metabacillus sediminilitoris TaxID=2567941 RepID=A0A4S4BXW8_9BACI|nr:hypothetical protein [Metabacillus sediminilitoris]QGQ46321.1 hypothetical protein GMB29_14505 [Metabacillus sediminilitoris]THF79371.1 hypothetical protein E6W99_13610 [Metabacillus sediminilitoris]